MKDAIKIANVGIKMASELNNYHYLINLSNLKGLVYRNISKFDSALYYHKSALNLISDFGTKQQKIQTLNNIGVVYRRIDENNSAIYYRIEALKLATEINDKNSIAISNNSIGNIYLVINNPIKAIEHFKISLAIHEKNNNTQGLAINNQNLGAAYQSLQNYEEALTYFYKPLEYNIEDTNGKGIAICYNSIGKILREKGDYKSALAYYKKALEIDQTHQDDIYKTNSLINIGEIYFLLKNYDKAISYLLQAKSISKSIGSKQLTQLANEHLYEVYKEVGNYEKAIDFYQRAVVIKDSLAIAKTAERILELQSDYDLRQKTARIQMLESEKWAQTIFLYGTISGSILLFILVLLLWKSYLIKKDANKFLTEKHNISEKLNSELKQVNEKLNELNRTKDKFFSIIAHDLKNPFFSILTYSENMVENYNDLDDKAKLEQAIHIKESSRQIYKLVENLLEWSRSQTGALKFQPTEFDFYELALNSVYIIQKLAKSKNISITNNIQPETIVVVDYNMLNAVMRNLLTNAVKFTNQNGSIVIKGGLKQKNDLNFLEVKVIDNGIGITESRIANLFSIERGTTTSGTSNETGTGLGLILCKEFIEKHNAAL